ncbi:S-layer homology domain-containing protein [Thermoclostridium caenicola]|uniref:S-layer homology domain-containing protein n=1 Tax=Thermoclostridium caenicola TaxID=659425 RepID=A0A1M6H7B3_9FIRM|nr:S-layer homology domain-containing protein [Thermoclostridium caenicola]SHJ18098.1 S-layer homology domain-containing protein [Thermoclostridium caenicola]
MKKFLAFLSTVIMVLAVLPSGMSRSHAAVSFNDVPRDAWYYEHVQYVANHPRELMVGYAGNFGPLDNLTVEQFIKIAVAAAGKGVVVPSDKYWGDVYVSIGLELGFVQPGEFTDYKRPITRAEMARIIIRSLPMITGEKDIPYNENEIRSRIADYDGIPVNLREYVCKAYQLGILVGGTDGKFNPNGNLTRASAAAVIHKMLEPGLRTIYTPPEEVWSDEEFEAYIRENAEDFYAIAKIEDRKIYLRTADKPTPTLLSDKYNPDIHELLYECAKTMAYYAQKNGNAFSIAYSDFFGGSAILYYYVDNKTTHPSIKIEFYAEPRMNYVAERYAPGEQKNPALYSWTLSALYDDDYLLGQGWEPDKDRKKFSWIQDKYAKVLLHLSNIVYGPSQGKAFYDFMIEHQLHAYYTDFSKDDKYIGKVPNANIEVAYYFKVPEAMDKWFWTTKPEVRK